MIVIEVQALASPGRFSASVDGREVVQSSKTPFLDAARVLRAEGVDPGTLLVMRHKGSNVDALKAALGVAAGMAVREDDRGRLRFTPYAPYSRSG
jgi:hypothetical protein